MNQYTKKITIDYLSPMEYYEREKEKRFLSQTGWTYTYTPKTIDFLKITY